MKTTKICAFVALLCAGVALTGCEDDEYCMAQWLFHDGDKSDSSSPSKTEPSASAPDKPSAPDGVSGTWYGHAGTGQTKTVLRLRERGGSLSGSWTWGAGDTRECSGRVSGSSVILRDDCPDGDTWRLTLSSDGTSLSGIGFKYGGGTYNVSFTR